MKLQYIKGLNINHVFILFSCLIFVFLPFRIISNLHMSHVFLALSIFLFLLNMKRKINVNVFDSIILIILIKLISDLIQGEFKAEYSSTYFAFTLNSVAILFLFKTKVGKETNTKIIRIFCRILFLHSAYIIIEFILFNIFNDYTLLNPFGSFSPIGPDPTTNIPGAYNPLSQIIKRPNGLNWEPSAAGFWQLFFIVTLITNRTVIKKYNLYIYTATFACVLTFSLLAWVSLVGLFIILMLRNRSATFIINVSIIVISLLLIVITLINSEYNLFLLERIMEINERQSSGYVRVVAPINLLLDNGIGIVGIDPIGVRSYQNSFDFSHAGKNELSGIANSYFEFIYYFGFLGMVFLTLLLLQLIMRANRSNVCLIFVILITPAFGGYVFNSIYFSSALILLLLNKKHL